MYMQMWRAHGLPAMRQMGAGGVARDIIGKMASSCGEVSGASSVFCGAILGKVQTLC